MRNVNLYSSGSRGRIGQQARDQIGLNPTIPFALKTPKSAWASGLADMVRALTAKSEKNKEDKIRSSMLAAMIGPEHEYDPSKASESFTPSEYVEAQRVALADAQALTAKAEKDKEDALFEGALTDNMASLIDRGGDALGGSVDNVFPQQTRGEQNAALDAGQRALFGADPASNPAMQKALIGDIKTPLGYAGDRGGLPASTEAEELAAYAGSAEDRAAQERAYRATVNTPGAEEARMAQLVASNPEIANTAEYAQWVQSNLARKQVLRDAATARGQAADVAATKHQYELDIEAAKKDPSTGPFEGTSMDAQRSNILLTGNPSTPEYLAAYVGMAEPKVIVDPATGRTTTVKPDMSPYRVPDRMQSGELENVYGDGGSVQETSETRIDPQIKKTIDATITNSASLINSLISYRDAFTSAGTWEGLKSVLDFSTPEGQAWTSAGVMAKGDVLFDLGVLAGEDLALIRKAFPDPSTVLGQLTPDKEVRDAVDRVINIIQDKISAEQKIHNLPVTDIRAFSAELRNIRGEQGAQRTSKTNEEIIDGLVGKDKEAYDWALDPKNRSTPQATKILKRLGIN